LLQFLGIERPPLGAAPAASIYQGSAAASEIASLCGHISQGLSILNGSARKPCPTDRCQSGNGVDMHRL